MDASFLQQQLNSIIGQLHSLFDDIGVPNHEREKRESELFNALSETLQKQLRLVTTEKQDMIEEAHRLVKNIAQMEASLDDEQRHPNYPTARDLQVTYPLHSCLQALREKHNTVAKLHRERYEQVRKLVQALESYASHLESSFVRIKLPPAASPNGSVSPTFDLSPTYVSSLDAEFTRVYEEYVRRVDAVKAVGEEMVTLWAELGTPQAQTDGAVVKYAREAPEQLGLRQEDLARLRARRDKLVEEKRGRERRLRELRGLIEGLWERLGVEEQERRGFLAKNRGCGLRTINEFEDELARLNELKRQNLHLFVEDARCTLQALWDDLYFSEEEMLEFTPAFSDVYSDALLSAHEQEIARLEALKEQRLPTLQMIEKHRSLIKDRDDLQASSQDASRLMARGTKGEKRDPTRLLREEKMRKRIAKELPKVESDLKQILESWEDEYGRPFLVHGQRYLDELYAASAKPAPPRSKTPSVPPPSSRPPKSAPASQKSGTLRGAPPPRAKTPTTNFGMSISRNPLIPSSASTAASARSPSRIPARAPLSSLQHGENSPERRRYGHDAIDTATLRASKMGPPRAPPPKMKDLFVPPPQQQTPRNEHGGELGGERSVSVVRHVPPEDVYDDRALASSYMASSMRFRQQQGQRPLQMQRSESHLSQYSTQSGHSSHSSHSAYSARGMAPSVAGSSRQISATSNSTVATGTVSGSENWETYDDDDEYVEEDGGYGVSEPEPVEVEQEYYARLRAARMQMKRLTPEGGYSPPRPGMGKRVKEQVYAEEQSGALVRIEGSEVGWTDEDAF
ncbi:Microtubule bundling protein [Coniosporium apollinis]|uniref:Microtubule bundling protein n=1 Tax=Coniosporium apollinis TaxID=61459 RepID=A0ABQ9NR46_9PEZI|nr:Microtubule bundling protein [Coniosporium apollinis]